MNKTTFKILFYDVFNYHGTYAVGRSTPPPDPRDNSAIFRRAPVKSGNYGIGASISP